MEVDTILDQPVALFCEDVMPAFHFNPALPPDANLDAFWTHLGNVHPKYAKLLEANMAVMLPLAPTGADRTNSRLRFNAAISKTLDAVRANQQP